MKACSIPLCIYFLFAFSAILWAGDMTLITENNEAVILHADNTWEYKDRTLDDPVKNRYIGINDGRIIKIATDYTWKFATADEANSNENTAPDSIIATGTAFHIGLPEAQAIALKKAIERATTRLQTVMKPRKLDTKKLSDCIRRVEKETKYEENFTQGKGWNVSLLMVLDKGSIIAVLECATPPKPPAGEEKKKKEKKGK